MDFPYVEFRGLIEERIFRPMAPVSFSVNGKSFNSYCLIDSGADYTILPIEAAKMLNLKLTHDESYQMQGAGGNVFKIYKSPVEIDCRIEKRGYRSVHWKSPLYFSESGSLTLLGHKGFFEFCNVNLKAEKRELILAANW